MDCNNSFYPARPFVVSRSRKGAWIEIKIDSKTGEETLRRSRKGAWIEIPYNRQALKRQHKVAPVRERGLKKLTQESKAAMTVWSLP